MGTDMSNGFTFYLDAAGWVLNDAIPVTNGLSRLRANRAVIRPDLYRKSLQ